MLNELIISNFKFKSKTFFYYFLSFLLLLLCFDLSFSQTQSSIYVNSLELEITHNLGVELLQNSPNPILNELRINSHYILLNISKYQILENYSFIPSSIENKVFLKNDEEQNLYRQYIVTNQDIKDSIKIEIENKYLLTSNPFFPKITSKQKYPIDSSKLEHYSRYLQFSEMINTNSQIQEKAFKLAYGEDDVFVIATKIANWLEKEIDYDLSTIFENPNQNAVEIFNSKRGVCKELSIIYISMLRSLQIPARMALGYSYTTSQDIIDVVGDNWGGHAWVEVLIGDVWVPFDLAYKQYGYVGSTHLLFQRTADIDELGVFVEMSSRGYEFAPNSLTSSMQFEILNQSDLGLSDKIKTNSALNSSQREYESRSYVFLEATIENPHNYYLAQEFQLVFPQELIKITPNSQLITLKPNSEIQIGYILQIPEGLDNYIFPISLFSTSDFQSSSIADFEIISRQRGIIHTREYVDLQLEVLENINFQRNNIDNINDFELADKEINEVLVLQNNEFTNIVEDIIREELFKLDTNYLCRYDFKVDLNYTSQNTNYRTILENTQLYLKCNLDIFFDNLSQLFLDLTGDSELELSSEEYILNIELCSSTCSKSSFTINDLILNEFNKSKTQIKTPTRLHLGSILRINSNSKPINKEISTNTADFNFDVNMNNLGNLEIISNKFNELNNNSIILIEVTNLDLDLLIETHLINSKKEKIELDLEPGNYDFTAYLYEYNSLLEEETKIIKITRDSTQNSISSILNDFWSFFLLKLSIFF